MKTIANTVTKTLENGHLTLIEQGVLKHRILIYHKYLYVIMIDLDIQVVEYEDGTTRFVSIHELLLRKDRDKIVCLPFTPVADFYGYAHPKDLTYADEFVSLDPESREMINARDGYYKLLGRAVNEIRTSDDKSKDYDISDHLSNGTAYPQGRNNVKLLIAEALEEYMKNRDFYHNNSSVPSKLYETLLKNRTRFLIHKQKNI